MNKVKLGEVVDIISGFAFDSKMFNDYKGTPLIRIRDIKRGYTETYTSQEYDKKYIIKKGDILIGMDGEFNIGKWKEKDALLNQRVCKIIPKKIDEDYMFFLLPKKLKEIENKTAFVTVKHLSVKQIENIEINLIEIEQQKEIAKKLRIISRIIEIKQIQKEQLDELIKSQFVEMFMNINFNHIVKVEDVCTEMKIGPFGSALHKNEISKSGEIFVLGTDNAVDNEFKVYEKRFISNEKYQELIKYTVHPKDIIISMMGTIGRTAIIPDDFHKAIISSHLCYLTVNEEYILPEFLQQTFKHNDFIDYQINKQKKGAIMNGLNLKIIKSLEFDLPSIELQKQFVEFVKLIDKQKFEIQKSLDEMQNLYESLMNEYFG